MIMEREDLEIELLLNGIIKRYGYDFTHYSYDSLKRRLTTVLEREKIQYFTELLHKVFHDEKFFDTFLQQMSVTVTEMFRDPEFYLAVRTKVIPILKTFPFIKIWHAGCATGEEVYSMAILLHEEGFLERTRFYATDFNKYSLDTASKGIYPLERINGFSDNYKRAGGKHSLSDYYSSKYDFAKFKDFLKDKITFSYHNLVTDGVFGEMNLICCRNVLIYFDGQLQNQVLSLFMESLRHDGFLCLGSNEGISFTGVETSFREIDRKQRIYKKQEKTINGVRYA
jgi:chemotaxis protein methyltransferase CheR